MKHPRDYHVILGYTSLPCVHLVHVCTIYPACGPWKLGVWIFVPVPPAWQGGYSFWKWVIPGNSELLEKWHSSTGRATESRTENNINGMKKTCSVLHPSLQNVPTGISRGFTPRKEQLGAFPAVVGLPEQPGKCTWLNGEVSLIIYLSNSQPVGIW